jgi:nitroimidazol reductase NimA-like FMN-containing flavoprotein (pyridoxamine 5'-phosphate oxidase superfamily)
MFIHEMSENECRTALKRVSFGRLACAHGDQPYVIPTYFASEGYYLYGSSTLGQKIEWMRANPRVCVEIDELTSHDEWTSVIVLGRYEELPNTPENKIARALALELLQRRAMWWEPAYVSASHRDMPHSSIPISYRIHIDRITGHRATPDIVEVSTVDRDVAPAKRSWLGNIRRWMGKDRRVRFAGD